MLDPSGCRPGPRAPTPLLPQLQARPWSPWSFGASRAPSGSLGSGPPRQSAVGWHSWSCTLEVNQRLGRPRLHCSVVRKLLRARLGKMMVVLR